MLTRLILLICAVTVGACAPMATLPPPPVVAAQTTVLDEKAAISVELAYQASALALRGALRSGLVDPGKAASIDATAYAAVKAVRLAYDTGNAADYGTAIVRARQAVAAVTALVKGDVK